MATGKASAKGRFDWGALALRSFYMVLGGFLGAAGVNLFLAPFKLLTAGVAGVALLIHYLVPALPIGVTNLALNAPIFILGWLYVDRKFTLWSLFGMVSLSAFLDLTSPWAELKPVKDLYMSLIAGGLMSGVGVGLAFKARGSMGGTDIIAAILRKYFSTSIGTAQFGLNAAIVMLLGIKFSLQSALASAFSIFFEAWAMDRTIVGLNTNKALMVITDFPREVGEALMERLDRGCTYLMGKGGFRLQEKEIVYCIMATRQLSQAKAIVEEIDPHSFTTVLDTVEVIGHGFRRMPI
jgi:uncharacterized membrane-anchored protein YitT (DUF2179 family)